MRYSPFLILTLLTLLWAGCNKSPTAADNPPPSPDQIQMPTQAQPKLPTMRIYINTAGPLGSPRALLDAELALTPQEEVTGMMFRTNIPEDDSMLFVLPYPTAASFWMTNCPVSESAAYISPDGVIEEIHHFEKNDATPVVATNQNIQFVLETADGWFARHKVNFGMVKRTEKGTLSDTFLRQ